MTREAKSAAVLIFPGMNEILNHSPIHRFTDFQELHQSNHGTAGNREAGGFVNSVVSVYADAQCKQPIERNRETVKIQR